jgi:adenylate cyclase
MVMAQEIERKWKLSALPMHILGQSLTPNHIRQGYLVVSNQGEVRFRHDKDGYTLTFKGEGSISREEENYTLKGPMGFELFLTRMVGGAIEKNRYSLAQGDITFEIDDYQGALTGLVIVEVEFSSIEQANDFILPEWLRGGTEVTNDKRFKNKYLATHLDTVRGELGF